MTTAKLNELVRLPKLLVHHETYVVGALHKASHGWQLRLSEMLLVVAEEHTDMRSACRALADYAYPLIEVPRSASRGPVTISVFDPLTAPYVLDNLPFGPNVADRPHGTIALVAEYTSGRMQAGYFDPALLRAFAPAALPLEPRHVMDFSDRYQVA